MLTLVDRSSGQQTELRSGDILLVTFTGEVSVLRKWPGKRSFAPLHFDGVGRYLTVFSSSVGLPNFRGNSFNSRALMDLLIGMIGKPITGGVRHGKYSHRATLT